MEASCRSFIVGLVGQSPGLEAAYRETIEYWSPDEPPVTTLFAALGNQIAEDLDKVSVIDQTRTFQLIETAMVTGDEKLVTAVATGLIEAILGKVSQQEHACQRVMRMFGSLSRKHAEAWAGS